MSVNFNMTNVVRDYLNRNDWRYKYNAEEEFIECGIDITCKLKSLRLIVDFREYGFINYAVCNLKADEDCRMEVLKYLTMANQGLRNGNFEIDLDDGEVCYKVYTNCDGMSSISDDVLLDCIFVPASMFDRFGNGLAAIMMGFSDAETEYAKIDRG